MSCKTKHKTACALQNTTSFKHESLGENKKRMLYYLGNSIVVGVLVEVIRGL
jgi:hypothetical protein